jgi:hypothetical protein
MFLYLTGSRKGRIQKGQEKIFHQEKEVSRLCDH